MTPEEFRSAGHALVDWIADLRASIEDRPVMAQVSPGDVREQFSAHPPTTMSDIEEMIRVLEDTIVPGITEVQHPMHFGWFPSNASLASVLGDMASSGLGSLGISWESSPALTEVEEVVCDWMRQLVGLSPAWRGTIHDTASTACLVALLAARERATDFAQNRKGLQGVDRPLTVYTTSQAHSSVAKAALMAGYGWDNIQIVEATTDGAMRPDSLEALVEEDLARGCQPAAVVATVGTTAVTAVDPVAGIVEVASRHGLFVHVDAAMAGTAMLLTEYRHLWAGIEGADSITWNPHKWMGTILDTSLFYVRDVGLLTSVMATNPSYLGSHAEGEVTQYRNWGVPLGRRFRALKLLFHLELDGVESIKDRIRRDLGNAAWLAKQVEGAVGWHLVAPVILQTVCVRHDPGGLSATELDEYTCAWVGALNASGAAYLTAAQLDDGWMARVSIGVEGTERRHVEAMWRLMNAAVSGEKLGPKD